MSRFIAPRFSYASSSNIFSEVSNSGNVVRNVPLNINSTNETPVVRCGVVRYANNNFRTSVLQFLDSTCAIRILFINDLFYLSTSPLAEGCNGVTALCFSTDYIRPKLRSTIFWNGQWYSIATTHSFQSVNHSLTRYAFGYFNLVVAIEL